MFYNFCSSENHFKTGYWFCLQKKKKKEEPVINIILELCPNGNIPCSSLSYIGAKCQGSLTIQK